MSFPNFLTNSYIFSHSSPYKPLYYACMTCGLEATFLYTDNLIFCKSSFLKKKQSAKTNKAQVNFLEKNGHIKKENKLKNKINLD